MLFVPPRVHKTSGDVIKLDVVELDKYMIARQIVGLIRSLKIEEFVLKMLRGY